MATTGGSIASVGREDASSCGVLISRLLRRLGHDPNDPQDREIAKEALNESVDEFNIDRNWMDRLLVRDIALAADQDEYNLPSRFRETIGRAWIINSSSERILEIAVRSYTDYLLSIPFENVSSGSIYLVTVRNRVDGGLVKVHPAPSSAWITNNPTLRLLYFADIPHCTSDNDALGVSTPLEQAIFINALAILNDELGDIEKATRFIRRAEMVKARVVGWDNKLRLKDSRLKGLGYGPNS
jgi:hypothetical protein